MLLTIKYKQTAYTFFEINKKGGNYETCYFTTHQS